MSAKEQTTSPLDGGVAANALHSAWTYINQLVMANGRDCRIDWSEAMRRSIEDARGSHSDSRIVKLGIWLLFDRCSTSNECHFVEISRQ